MNNIQVADKKALMSEIVKYANILESQSLDFEIYATLSGDDITGGLLAGEYALSITIVNDDCQELALFLELLASIHALRSDRKEIAS